MTSAPDFDALMKPVAERAAARRLVTIEEVGAACASPASNYAGAIAFPRWASACAGVTEFFGGGIDQ